MLTFLLLAPMMFLSMLMSMTAGIAAMLSAVLTLVMGAFLGSLTVCSTALLGIMVLIFS